LGIPLGTEYEKATSGHINISYVTKLLTPVWMPMSYTQREIYRISICKIRADNLVLITGAG
jgi:hypothetical protein